jgi:hypothetical protein
MRARMKLFLITIGSVLFLMPVVRTSVIGNLALAQEPTTRVNNVPKLSLTPLVILNVGSGEIAAPVSSPTGAPRPVPEFFLPRNSSKEITVTTSGGNVSVRFSNSVPPGIPAAALQWEQSSVPAGNAVGHLKYNGCSSCPASFTLEITAASNEVVHVSVKLKLTASSARPVVSGVTANGGDNVEPRFEIRVPRGAGFDLSDTQIIGTYASGLRYRLIPESNSIADGQIGVTIPRLEVDRTVKVALVNPYGSSSSTNVTLPQEGIIENPVFEQVNASGEFPDPAHIGDTFSVKHTNNGLLDASGADDIPIQPLASSSACNRRDYIFQSARVSWLADEIHVPVGSGTPTSTVPDQPVTTPGPISIASQPPVNAFLRSPNNKIRVNWTLKARFGDVFYQVLYRGVEVVGVCSDRVVH